MIVELSIIKYFITNVEDYNKYKNYIDPEYFKSVDIFLYKIYSSLESYIDSLNNKLSCLQIEHFATYCYTQCPKRDQNKLSVIFEKLKQCEVSDNILSLLNKHKEQKVAFSISQRCIQLVEGDKDSSKNFVKDIRQLLESIETPEGLDDREVYLSDSDSLADLLQREREALSSQGDGLSWRLGSLNQYIGPLNKGDFGVIFARPEVGKTGFIISDLVYKASQLKDVDGPICFFNNEEHNKKIITRFYSSLLEVPLGKIYSDVEYYSKLYQEKIKGKLKLFPNERSILVTKQYIEDVIKKENPSLIVIDSMDAVKGFGNKWNTVDEMYGSIYQWGRDLSQLYCPVIGVCHAKDTLNEYLVMEDMTYARTAKQAKCDFILGISLPQSIEDAIDCNIRNLSLCKNKVKVNLTEDINNNRHPKWQVEFDQVLSIYKDSYYYE